MVMASSERRQTGGWVAGQIIPLLAASSAAAALISSPSPSVTTFRVCEVAVSADRPGSTPYLNGPSVTATFTGTSGAAAGTVLTMKGFWDGGSTWRIRFAPTATGGWSWTTCSTDAGTNGFSGSFAAVSPTPAELAANELYHGFLTRDGYAWRLSDGRPFLAVGDTAWSFSEEYTTSEWQQWMSARQAQHFNTFLGCVWLAIYSRAGVPEAFTGKNPQTDSPNVAYFQRLDTMVQYANDHGIMMGLTIGGFPGNSAWWSKFNTQARDDRWFRYCVARYTAYNVRWCLYGEVNEANPPWGTWQSEVLRKAQLIKDEDPYDHPIGSHHTTIDTRSIGNANIDYLDVQIDQSPKRSETQYQKALTYRGYGKPVWFEEYWYESKSYDNECARGIRNTHRNFVHAMAFPTFASLMRQHFNATPPPDVGELSTDPGAVRMGYFHEFYKNLDFMHFTPSTPLVSSGQCGRFGDNYAIFKAGGGSVTLNLSGVSGDFDMTEMDIHTGATAGLGRIIGGGTRTLNPNTSSDVAILVIKRAPSTPSVPSIGARE